MALSLLARPHSLLSVVSDGAKWVLDDEARALIGTARSLGIDARLDFKLAAAAAQCRHYASQFILLEDRPFETRHRISVDYLHGAPGADPAFGELFEALLRRRERLFRVRVSHQEMRKRLLASGFDPSRLHCIPLGVELARFRPQTPETRRAARGELELPEQATIIGSFQKDGVGWGDGAVAKLIKGPDVFLRVIEALRGRCPGLFVLLTGPARGYLKTGLTGLGVPFAHRLLAAPEDVARCYEALDAYVVASRDEGGPKAVLEAMASGVPLVSTRVGQAADLVRHGENGFLAAVEDSAALARWVERVLSETSLRESIVAAGLLSAAEHSYDAQRPLWARFFEGFVA